MDASTLIGGGIEPAIAETSANLRSRPTDAAARTRLFDLLCLTGSLDRAFQHLSLLDGDGLDGAGPQQHMGVAQYRNLLALERERREVFAGSRKPASSRESIELVELHSSAAAAVSRYDIDSAVRILETASDNWCLPACTADSEEFDEIRDCDDLIAPFLEVIAGDSYRWVAWWEIDFLQLSPPRYLRDLVWLPAILKQKSGIPEQVFLPARYPNSESGSDDLRLGRTTVWTQDALTLGQGQRMLALGDAGRDLRTIQELKIH